MKFCWMILLLAAATASAETVVLESGRKIVVQSYSVQGNAIQLALNEKSEMVIPLEWVREIRATPPEASAVEMTHEWDSAFAPIVWTLSRKHSVDWKLVAAVMKVESNCEPRAISPKGALGLMQLMPETARLYKVRNPYDPQQNIEAGVKHLKMLMARYRGNLKLALAAYNSGVKAVEQYRGIPPYQETRLYVEKVLRLYQDLSSAI